MGEALAYTTAEAAFVLREPIKAVKKALDEGPVEAQLVHKPGARPVRAIAWADLLYLLAIQAAERRQADAGREEVAPGPGRTGSEPLWQAYRGSVRQLQRQWRLMSATARCCSRRRMWRAASRPSGR